jgi:GDP/UDP-N,N'-diacetylbacillosamine 2-epimerase (hydrolysing)
MKRKICFVTGSRADYGLLRCVMQEVKVDPELTLQVIATGMHLSSIFGLTYKDIEADGFVIDRKVLALSDDDTPVGIGVAMSNVLVGCAEAFRDLRPDIIVVLGDRFEIFAAVSAALVARIPIAHLHGGESTVGAFDEAMRHSITKMSHLHFVAAKEYRDRVIQLGESPERVFLVGGIGLDNLKSLQLLAKQELEASLNLKFDKKSLLITFHPVTLEDGTEESQITELFSALSELEDTTLIITFPNADTGGQSLIKIIEEFVQKHKNAKAFPSLGQVRYLSCLSIVDAVVGNSSSGLIEAPSFRKGTINIGERQLGRLQASSVINCLPERVSILAAIKKLYSNDFQLQLSETINPYGEAGGSSKVVEILRTVSTNGIVKKSFHDL